MLRFIEEPAYKILFLALFIPGALVRSIYAYRIRSYVKGRSLKERLRLLVEREGYLGASLLMCQGITLLAGVAVYLPFTFPWFQLPLPHILRFLGFIVGIPGLALLAWTHRTLDKYWSITIEFREEHQLLTSGPYRWVRHPMYTAHLIYFLSWLLVTANVLFLANYLLTVAIIFNRIPREEKELIGKFGEKYVNYMEKTKKLFPTSTRLPYLKQTPAVGGKGLLGNVRY